MLNFVESVKEVNALVPQAGGAVTGDYISLKNVIKAWVVVTVYQDTTDVVAITIEQATAVANTGSKAITNVVPIWANEDNVATDTMVRQTDAVTFSTSATADKIKKVIFEIDPATLDTANDFDCITVKTAASDVTNLTEAHYILEMKYKEDVPPSVVTD